MNMTIVRFVKENGLSPLVLVRRISYLLIGGCTVVILGVWPFAKSCSYLE